MWQLLAKPLLGVVADGVKGFVDTKKAKQELKLTTIKATQKLKEDQIAGKVCLLYTSPSPRDRTRSRMPSSA